MKKTLFLIAVLAITVMPLQAQDKSEEQLRKEYEGVAWEEAHVVESQHYTVKCNSIESVAKRYSDILEKLALLYKEIFPNLYTKKMKWEAWIYKTRREFNRRHPKRAGVTAGFYAAGGNRIYTYHGLFGVSGSTFNILAHEGMHAFQHSFLKSYYEAPDWLREGMAVVFEGIEVGEDGKLSLENPPRDRIVQVKVEMKEGKALKLSQVVGEKAEKFSRRKYAYAGLFMWWLTRTTDKRRKLIDDLLTTVSTRSYRENDIETLLQSYLGKNISQVDKEWKNWIRKQKVEYTGRKIPGGTYTSRLLHFTIKRPDTDWVMDGDKAPVNGECIVFLRNRTGGRISVTAYVNQLPLYADELYFQWLDDLEDSVKDLAIEQKERLELKKRPGFRIRYVGEEPDSRITKEKQRVELRVIVTMRNIYVVRVQSAPDKWERNRNDFANVLDRFKLLK